MTKDRKKAKSGSPRSAARLAAIQALYQLENGDETTAEMVVQQYIDHRLGQEIEGDQYVEADQELFSDITKGAWNRRSEWDDLISEHLSSGWKIERLDIVLLGIIRAGVYELKARPDVPTPVVINEYVDVANAFFERTESAFINGILDRIGKKVRT